MKKGNVNKDNYVNKGFTLVELIVVLIILAILAAVLVPVLTGYIEQARSKKDLRNAKALMEATQAAFVELYAQNPDVKLGDQLVPNNRSYFTNTTKPNNNYDQDVSETDFAMNILKLADFPKDKNGNYDKPYIFMVATGSNAPSSTVEPYEKFTIYYGMYMETKNSKPWYYYNGEWTTLNPRSNNLNPKDYIINKDNTFASGPLKNKKLQYYVIVNTPKWTVCDTGAKNFWDNIKKLSD